MAVRVTMPVAMSVTVILFMTACCMDTKWLVMLKGMVF